MSSVQNSKRDFDLSPLRRLSLKDASILRELAVLTYRDTYKDNLSEEEIDSRIETRYKTENFTRVLSDREGELFWGAFQNEQLIAYLHLSDSGSSETVATQGLLQLSRIYVHPKFKNQGIGKILMTQAEDVCAASGSAGLRLHCYDQNLESISFYQKLGFRVVGKDPFEIIPGCHRFDVVLVKHLPGSKVSAE